MFTVVSFNTNRTKKEYSHSYTDTDTILTRTTISVVFCSLGVQVIIFRVINRSVKPLEISVVGYLNKPIIFAVTFLLT